jgi:glycosyltransferase involved in cell wall biosynthesis
LFKPGDSKDLSEQLVKLLSNNDLRRKLGQGAVNSTPKFAAANIAKEWINLYGEVIEKYHK